MSIVLQTVLATCEARQPPLLKVDGETSVLEASKLMRRSHAEELLVVDKSHGLPFAFGILTANDIVTRVMATELDPAVLTAGDIAWPADFHCVR